MPEGLQPIPVKLLCEYAYCPRLFHLMHVDGRWEENYFTEQGAAIHKRTDSRDDPLPSVASVDGVAVKEEPTVARSVMLTDESLGIVGKLDLMEADGSSATPVEMKRGSVPNTPLHSYEPERVQLMAQGLLLRSHGFQCTGGIVYYASSHKRISVIFDADLEAKTRSVILEARRLVESGPEGLPPPLEDSPKCNGCSLSGICLPDETRYLEQSTETAPPPDIRRLYPARDDALPLYIQEQGARVGKSGEALEIEKSGVKVGHFLLKDISQLVLCGNISISAQCLNLLCEKGIPIVHLSMGHWFYGITHGHGLKNAYDRAAQFSIAANETRSLLFAKAFVRAKAQNQRTLLRRNAVGIDDDVLENMRLLIARVDAIPNAEELLGLEGSIAALYFSHFHLMLQQGLARDSFRADSRNRRPPRDPLNAMLSFGYALLSKDATITLMAEGLDPWWGLYHRPRHGRPALALDFMEEFRPLIVDSAVITAINTNRVTTEDFIISSAGCAMKDGARKALIMAYEQRMDQLLTHPVFDYRCSWRAVMKVQAKLLSKALRGEIKQYVGITTR